jgi:Spy/CpxP family protein refolding chaperone
MKKLYCACVALILLIAVTPLFAQEADLDDEDAILMVADLSAQDPPAAAQGKTPASTNAHQGMMGRHQEMMDGRGRWEGHRTFLNLTQDQIAKMRDLHTRYYGETRNLRYDLMQRRLEMRRLFLDPKADSASILAKQKELSAARQGLMDAMARMMVEWRAILTPEQIQKLDMAALAHGRMGGMMMGGGMGHRDMMDDHDGRGMMGRGAEAHGMMDHTMESNNPHAGYGRTGEEQ